MWTSLLKAGGYTLAAREISNLFGKSRKEEELKRSQNLNMLLGITFGTAIGVTTGLLMAPRSGRETRDRIAARTHSLVDQMKESAHQAKKDVERDPHFRSAVESAHDAKDAVRKGAEKTLG